MTFANPLMLLGLLAAAVPIIIHLVNRRRAARVRFPALALLRRSERRLARRLKLKQLALLALRVLFFLLLPLAMAQPSLRCGGTDGSAPDARLPTSVVIVVDDSGSMSAPVDRGTMYEAAVAHAEGVVRDLRSWDRVAIVVASTTAEALVGEPIEDRALALQRLREHEPRFAGSDHRAALALAREIQQGSRLPAHRTVVVSDGTAAGWPALDEAPVDGLGRLEIIDVSGDDGAENLAVTSLTVERSASGAEGEHTISATIEAFGHDDAETVTSTLIIDGEVVAATTVEVGDERDGAALFTHTFIGDGPFAVEVAIESRRGPAVDDRRGTLLVVDETVRVLLVNGDARAVDFNDEVFFLSRALEVAVDDRRDIVTESVRPDAFASADLATFDVVVLANVGSLTAGEVSLLEAFVHAGGGLWFTVGSNVEADRWNSLFADLLPKPLRTVRVLADRHDVDAAIKATRVGVVDPLHPIFRVFALPGGESIRSALVFTTALLEPAPEVAATTVAAFADGGPALVERAVGRGRVLLWTTSIDADWTDLPIRTAYVPFVRRTAQYLARQAGGGGAQAEVGARLTLPTSALRPERVVVTARDGGRQVIDARGDDVTVIPGRLGFHDVSVVTGDTETPAPSLSFVAHAATSERDPTRLDDALRRGLEQRAAAAAPASDGGDAHTGPSAWPTLLFIALVALYLESLVGLRRRLWERLIERRRRGRDARKGSLDAGSRVAQ